MSEESMIRGIIELYEACGPDSNGLITQASFHTELGSRLPKGALASITKLFEERQKDMLSFIDFWSLVERTVSISKSFSNEDDDLACLRFLRDQVLGAINRKNGLRYITHESLIDMLTDVRNKAIDKSTWDEALRSSRDLASDPTKAHSVDTISAAIKVMLDDYLSTTIVSPKHSVFPVERVAPISGPPSCVPDLTLVVDELRAKLTDSECSASALMESNAKYVSEITFLKSELNSLRADNSRLKVIRSSEASMQQTISTLQSALADAKRENEKLKEGPSESLESNILVDSLKSQIKTLEAQKLDAEIEVTRLQKQNTAKDFVITPMGNSTPIKSGRSSATVSVYGQESSKRMQKKPAKTIQQNSQSNIMKSIFTCLMGFALAGTHRRYHFLHHTLHDVADTVVDNVRSVTGMCSGQQDALGSISPAGASGVSTLTECAQVGKDSAGTAAVYVSFNGDICLWFANCQCLASSSTCLGGDQWSSIAIADAFTQAVAPVTPAVVPQAVSAESAVFDGSVATDVSDQIDTTETYVYECDDSSSDLMKDFQTKCQMDETMTFTRIVAAVTIVGVLAVVASIFGIAYWFDLQDTS